MIAYIFGFDYRRTESFGQRSVENGNATGSRCKLQAAEIQYLVPSSDVPEFRGDFGKSSIQRVRRNRFCVAYGGEGQYDL